MKSLSLVAALLVLAAGPAITINPDSGGAGTHFVVTGSGFAPEERVKVLWDGENLGGTVKVGADGTFKYEGVVPDGATPGAHSVEAQSVGTGPSSAKTTFTVVAPPPATTTTVAPTTTSPAPGTTVATGSKTPTTKTPATEAPTTMAAEPSNTTVSAGSSATVGSAVSGPTDADPLGGPISTTAESAEAAGSAAAPPPAASSGTGGLIAALLAMIGAAGMSFLVWGRSKPKPEPKVVHTPDLDGAKAPPPVAPGEVEDREGEWVRHMMELTPSGVTEGAVGTEEGLIAFGRIVENDGAEDAAIWNSSDGITWESLATLGTGKAGLATVWRKGLLVAVSYEHDNQISSSCWCSDDTRTWDQLTDPDDPTLLGVSFEGWAANDDVVLGWGRGPEGFAVWFSQDGAVWRQSDLRGGIEVIGPVNDGFLAFGRATDGRRALGARSADGISWDAATGETQSVFDGAYVATLASFGGGVVVAGTDVLRGTAAVWVSDEGHRWLRTPFQPDEGTSIAHLAVFDDRLLAMGLDTGGRRRRRGAVAIWESHDAVSWERVPVSDLFKNSTATSMVIAEGSVLVFGTLFVDRDRAQPVPVPVCWRWSPSHIAEVTEPALATT